MPLIVICALAAVSTEVAVIYFFWMCEDVLERNFDRPYFQGVGSAIRLEFLSLVFLDARDSSLSADYLRLRQALGCDFEQLNFLIERAVDVPTRSRIEIKLLRAYFRYLFLTWAIRHGLRLRETRVILGIEEVLRYLANFVGRQAEIMRLGCAGEP